MNVFKVKRLYEIRLQKKELEEEEKLLTSEFKEEMLKNNTKEMVIGNFALQLQRQDRSEMDDTVVSFLKASGHLDLVKETYDRDKFKELEKKGVFDENELKKYRKEKIIYALYVKPC